jgi:hypothetical protein
MRISAFAILLSLAAGCGGDSSTAPEPTIGGTWIYTASNLSGGGVSCNLANITLTLSQTGSTFTGSSAGGVVSCNGSSGTSSANLGSSPIANGQINGNAIQFDIGTSDLHNAGTRSGNSMSGTLTANLTVSGTRVVLTGNFSAVKQ